MDCVSQSFDFQYRDYCVIIGEIGVNHNRDANILFRLIDAGIDAGVDIIKLQRFKAEEEIAVSAPTAEYQKRAGVDSRQLEMARDLELPDELLVKAFEYCKEKKVGFLCTAFDHSSVDFIADRLSCKSVKVPSPEVSNRPLLEHMARKFDSLLISSGAAYLSECALALDWISSIAKREIALMHCVSEYPAPIEEVNLKAMETMRQAFKCPVGFSDHTQGSLAAIVAASLGAAMIEKHYTLDKSMEGPDHQASADISELRNFVSAVRNVDASLGDGIKQPVPSELKNRSLIRKSLTCASEKLKVGTVLIPSMLSIKRPWIEGAVEPCDFEKIIGLRLTKEKSFDEPLLWDDFR